MNNTQRIEANYAVPPGATLAEWLEERRMTQTELASRINISEKALSQIVTGAAPLTRATALKLEFATGIPARTWNNLDAHYQEEKARLAQREQLENQADWLSDMPVAQLRKIGVITATAGDKAALVKQLLEFFGVSDPTAWRRLWLGPQAAFRQSQAFTANPAAVAAWLRLGELQAATMDVAEFSASQLRGQLPILRALTREPDPGVFVSQIKAITARCGVATVFVAEITGSRCSGAARWSHDRPIVQLSLRHRSDDHLWFTFFHELAHVLLHGKKDVFVSAGHGADSDQADKEEEANRFAGELLIPRSFEQELPSLKSLDAIRDFADRLGVSPGIVVGRLQKDKLIGYDVGNSLKKRYTFAAAPSDEA